jgi:hypothetical protein
VLKKCENNKPNMGCAVYYGCTSGSIGRLKSIGVEDFKVLKRIEQDIIAYIEKKERFSYEQWRSRICWNDKLIDESLIKYYLQEFKGQLKVNTEDFYMKVKGLYERCIA